MDFQQAFERSASPMLAIDAGLLIIHCNPALEQLFALPRERMLGRKLFEVFPGRGEQAQQLAASLQRVLETGESQRLNRFEYPFLAPGTAQSESLDLWHLTSSPLVDDRGAVTAILLQPMKASALLSAERERFDQLSQQITFQAAHDLLTGLCNRQELTRKMTLLEQGGGSHVLLYLDIDHFKIVNDRGGHAAGDALLVELARLLGQRINAPDLLARIGGDEFVVMLYDSTLERAAQVAEQLRASARQLPFVWGGRCYSVSLSIGIASFGGCAEVGFSESLGRADAACFLAKEKGRNQTVVSVLSDAEVCRQQQDMDWIGRLRESMQEDRVVLFGQRFSYLGSDPQQAQWTCYEILARLRDTDGELIAPGAFIPAAERFGLIGDLDRHIIAGAFALLQQLPPQVRAHTRYFINVSGLTLGSQRFVDDVLAILAAHPGVLPGNICFEVTETAAINNLALTGELLGQLVEHGFSFALDDFGSGMSSFGYLQQLPVHYLKIDGELISALRTPPVGSLIVESMIRIAQALNIQVIAESVEWVELVPELRAIGADYAQGFALHRPERLSGASDLPHGINRRAG